MNKEIEEKFVKNFIVKDKRERLIYELGSAKKRALAIQRIYTLLDRKFAVLEDSQASDEKIIFTLKKFFNTNNECYVISETEDDGKFIYFEQAYENMKRFEVNYLIICNENTALMGEEYTTFGSPNKIILNKSDKN